MRKISGPEIKIPQASRWAVFISGRGSNLQTLLDHSLTVGLVVTSKKKAPAVFKARRFGVPVYEMTSDWDALQLELKKRKINRVLLLGFMKIVPEKFVRSWKGRIYNLHPSMLPEFKGLKAFERSIEEKFDLGATFHEVIEELDAGKILLQKSFFPRAGWSGSPPSPDRLQWGLSFCEHQLTREGFQRCR